MVCLCISKISCCYLIITWMLTYIRVSKNIQKKIKFRWKIRIQHGPDKQDSSKKKCVLMKKLSKLLYLFYNTRVLYSDRGETPLWSECLPLLIRDSRYLVFCCHSVISLFTALYFSKNSTCKFNTKSLRPVNGSAWQFKRPLVPLSRLSLCTRNKCPASKERKVTLGTRMLRPSTILSKTCGAI